MATERANNLVAFKSFIDEQLSKGGPELSSDLWAGRHVGSNPAFDDRFGILRSEHTCVLGLGKMSYSETLHACGSVALRSGMPDR
jgi:hypothetical protein